MAKKNEIKRLYRSSTDKVLSGVCGGIAEYSNMDSTLIRVIAVLITVFTGFLPGIIAYIIMAIIMPQK
jgi:phage shock protein C